VTSLGLNSLITREVSKEPESARRFLASSALLGVVVSLAVAVGVVIVVHFAGYSSEVERGGWLVAASLFPSIVILYSESIFIAFEKVQYIVILAMVENLGRVMVGLWLLRHGFGVVPLIASFAGFRFLTLLLNLMVFHARITRLGWAYDSGVIRELVKNIPVFGSIFVVATLYWRADVFMLSKLASLAAVGYYTAGYRLFSISQVVPKSFNTSVYPVFAKLFHHSQESFQKANSLSIRYILVVLLPIAAGIHGLADPIVRILFGKDFAPAARVLEIVIWTLVPYGIVRVVASGLFASNRQAIDLKVNLLGLGSNFILNFALIPRFGVVGCAWATLISICLFLIYQCFFLRNEIFSILRQAEILRPALAAAGIVVWLRMSVALPLAARIAGGVLIYGLLLVILQVVRIRELKAIMPERFVSPLPEEHEP
jgi:O-antigen/teichoic acid export membrane protein